MGIVCGLYRIEDKTIDKLIIEPENSQNWIDENYSSIFGKFHIENETVFELDKGWAVAKFLLRECDPTKEKILQHLDGEEINSKEYDYPKYIKSNKVKKINEILKTINEESLKKAFSIDEMLQNNIYKADFFDETNWNYLIQHIDIIKNAFEKSAENNDGIVINLH